MDIPVIVFVNRENRQKKVWPHNASVELFSDDWLAGYTFAVGGWCQGKKKYHNLVPETSTLKWLFQLDDSKPLLGKWLFHQTSIKKWLFRVPGSGVWCGFLWLRNVSRISWSVWKLESGSRVSRVGMSYMVVFFFQGNRHTVDGSEIPFPTTVWMYKTGMVLKPPE